MDDENDDLRVQTPRRVEIFNGRGYRQRWSEAAKAKIVAESLKPGIVVTELSRLVGAHPSQIHGWRKDAREGRLALPAAAISNFTEVVVTPVAPASPPMTKARTKDLPPGSHAAIEIEAYGVQVRVRGAADPAIVGAIISALKGQS